MLNKKSEAGLSQVTQALSEYIIIIIIIIIIMIQDVSNAWQTQLIIFPQTLNEALSAL